MGKNKSLTIALFVTHCEQLNTTYNNAKKVLLLRGIAIRIQTTINKIFTTPKNEKN